MSVGLEQAGPPEVEHDFGNPARLEHLDGRMMLWSVRQRVHQPRHAPVDGGPIRGSGPPQPGRMSDRRKVQDQVR